jgi:hypothetical protein
MADRDFTCTLRRPRKLPEYPAHGLRSRAGCRPVITAARIVLEVARINPRLSAAEYVEIELSWLPQTLLGAGNPCSLSAWISSCSATSLF